MAETADEAAAAGRSRAVARSLALVLALAAALVVTAGIGASARAAAADAPAFVDGDHDGIDDTLEQTLANRFAPVILLEADESNYPVNVEWFLARAHLQYHEDCTGDDDEDLPGMTTVGSQQNLLGPPWTHGASFGAGHPDAHCGEDDSGDGHPPHRAITTIAADPDGEGWGGPLTTGYSDQQTWLLPDLPEDARLGSTDPSDWKTYFHAYPARDGGVMLQYWHLFAYNALGVDEIGWHGGDWDATIHVHLGPDLRTVERVWFSRHSNDHPGDALDRSAVTWVDGTHPLMAIDGGGHAAYASPADFATHHSVAGGTIAWPTDPADPLDPAKLALVLCGPGVGPIANCGGTGNVGGVVWRTADGALVTSGGQVTHPVATPRENGGMVNLGEYNPCDEWTCHLARQASPLLATELHPLNGQVFIQYSGRWGSLGSELPGAGVPPRGPVFQGWDDDNRVYTAWYNEAASAPVSPTTGNAPWRRLPTVAATLAGPKAEVGGRTVVGPSARLSLVATANPTAASFGEPDVLYRVVAAGAAPGPFLRYTGPIALPPGDGDYVVEDYAVDALRNQSAVERHALTLDSVAPATAASLDGPAGTSDGVAYVAGSTRVVLTASLASPVASLGTQTLVRAYRAGATPPPFAPYAGPFPLPAPDGAYVVEYRSVDVLGNAEAPHALRLTRDTTAPAIAIAAPTASEYAHSATLTLDYGATDAGVGGTGVSARLDGSATLAGAGLADGRTIPLLTELALGPHTLAVTAADRFGNAATRTVEFEVVATAASVKADVRQLVAAGALAANRARSLTAKLDAAQDARTCKQAANVYTAFLNELRAQTGKSVDPDAAAILTADVRYVVAHCG